MNNKDLDRGLWLSPRKRKILDLRTEIFGLKMDQDRDFFSNLKLEDLENELAVLVAEEAFFAAGGV